AAWLRNGRPPFLDNNAGSRRGPRPTTQDAPAGGWRPSDPILTPTLRRVFERRPFQSQGGVMSEVLTAPITAVARLQPAEHTMNLAGGMELFYRAWLPTAPARKAVLLFHRGHEHSGRWQETVEALALDDVAFFAWDARGHGRSPGERGAAENLAT